MFGSNALHCLQLNDHAIFYEQIRKIFTNHLARKIDKYPCLLFDFESHLAQCNGKSIFIHLFKKSVTQCWINDFEEGVQNLISNLMMF